MKTVNENDPRLAYCRIEQFCIPPTGLIEHIKDHYWIYHPERGLVMWGIGPERQRFWSPQCDSNEEITKRMLKFFPWAEIKFVPSFFRKINPKDYM